MPRPKRPREERNRLLNALPPDEYERIRPLLAETTLELRQRLGEPGASSSYVYFPWSGVCSLTATMRDGRMVEVGTIGNEGVVGMSGYFGGQLPDVMPLGQVPGSGAHVMRRGVFLAEMDRAGALYHLVRRYSQALLALMTQSVACNALPDIDQRCARWLLMTHDRVDGDVLELTQEYLATMLGVRRASGTDAARRPAGGQARERRSAQQ